MRRPLLVCAAVVCAFGLGSTADAQWTDATSGPLGDAAYAYGVAWGDYDGDGDLDLYLANHNSANKLFRNDGNGAFADATSGPLGDTGTGRGVAWADCDNDGDLDLYLANRGPNKLFRNDGDGAFADATTGPLGDTGTAAGVAWGDYDNDGDVDLYLVGDSGDANNLFRNNGDGTFTDVTSGPLGDAGIGVGAAWGDYDNDGDLDLFLNNYNSASRLFRNDGSASFVDVTNGPLGNTGMGMGLAWGDYDDDGDLDLYLAIKNSANKLCRNDGDGAFADATTGPLGDTGDSRGVAWGDYDNDGDLDLYLAKIGAANRLFRNDGGGFIEATSGPLGDTGWGRGVVWGDYDNDGDLDLYLANDGSANKLFRNDAAAGQHWLQVSLEGTISNRAGIGARVRVLAGGVSRIREISGGSSYLSQNAMVASFGLGAASTVDSLIVSWPSGIVQVVSPPAVDQAILVVEQEFDCTGTISGSVSDGSVGLGGITVKLLDDVVPTTVIDETTTLASGEYVFNDVVADMAHQIMVIEPLGYVSNQNYVARTVACDGSGTADFVLTPFVLVNNARSKGYWKHQFDVYVKNRGHAHETEAELGHYIEEVRDRYTNPHYQSIFVGMSDGVNDFGEWQAALSVKGRAGMEAKAMAQLAALALNVMSLKIGQYEVVAEDGRTAGDVLTYVSELLTDGDSSNDELAKDLAESVNHQETIASGVVPEGDIQYARPQVADRWLSVWPNPGGASKDYTLSFAIPVSGYASVEIYNVAGRRIAMVLSGEMPAGHRKIVWEGRDATGRFIGQGVYFARLTTPQGTTTAKFVHLGR